MYDCIIIGGGVVGCSIAYALSQKRMRVLLLEKCSDVSMGASKANSGIVHAGYDCHPHTNKAKFNVEGIKMYPMLCKRLHVPLLNIGSLVVGGKSSLPALLELQERGDLNGVTTTILEREAILQIEPNVADEVEYALYAPEACIVSPYKLNIALANFSVLNGVEIRLNSEVTNIAVKDESFTVSGETFSYEGKFLINAAGAGCERVQKMLNDEPLNATFKRGEYYLLDKSERANVSTVLFPLPDEKGKGILVAPTLSGNVIYGPTAFECEQNDTAVHKEGLEKIAESLPKTYRCPNLSKAIREYAGIRVICGDDFIIKWSQKYNNYFILGGICSPGLTSAPAIGKFVSDEIGKKGGFSEKEKEEIQELVAPKVFTASELNEMISKNPSYGRIVCGCEKVSEAEVVEAIHSPLPAVTTDAIKRRVRAGMGKCQGGFCLPKIMEIISRETGIPFDQIEKDDVGSAIVKGRVKEDL